MLTSPHNPRLARVRALLEKKKAREEELAFVAEGVRLVEEAAAAGWLPELVLYSAQLSERGMRVLDGFKQQGVEVWEIASGLMNSLTGTETAPGLLAVLPLRRLPLPEQVDFVLIVDHLRDPGNLGTLLRTAAAAGVQAVLATPGTVDPFAPKVLRAAMGAHFRLPLRSLDWLAIQSLLPAGMHVFLADSGGGQVFTACDFRPPLALVVGGEAAGAGSEAASLVATRQDASRVHIPMAAQVESLNAAVAGAVLLFEVARQRSM